MIIWSLLYNKYMKRTDILSIIMRNILTIFVNVVGIVSLILLLTMNFHILNLLVCLPPILLAIFGDIAILSKNEKIKSYFYATFVIFIIYGFALLMYPIS